MKGKTLLFGILAAAAAGIAADVCAQQNLRSGAVVTDAVIARHRDSVTVSMTFNLDNIKIRRGGTVFLHPQYLQTGGTRSAWLPPVEVKDRVRDIYLQRNPETAFADEVYCSVVKKRKEPMSVDYSVTLPYDEWMDSSRLQVTEDLCGCGEVDRGSLVQLADADLSFSPRLAYVVPEAEPVKTRELSGRSYLDFRVNRTEIDPSYRKNPVELQRIISSIDTVKNDTDFTITSIEIKGYASPEGSYPSNRRLAEGRTESLKKYLIDRYGFSSTTIKSSSEPENWEGLVEYLKTSTLADKDAILAHIENGPEDIDRKEREMKQKFPQSYKVILNDCYPGLRRTDYRIDYVIRSFNLDEAKELVKTAPQRLSLEEMFAVAQTYQPGSEDFNHVFDVAVRMYPYDETANLNAANALLEQGRAEEALKYLEKIKSSVPEAENARGVAYLLLKDYERAGQHIEKAVAGNLDAAKHNMEFLK